MSITVSYGHLACGLEIVSVAIPLASSCSIHLYNVLNSPFSLLPILCCTCGSQFSDWLRQVSVPVSAPSPCRSPSGPRMLGKTASSYPKRGPGILGLVVAKALGSENPFDCTIAGCPCVLYWIHYNGSQGQWGPRTIVHWQSTIHSLDLLCTTCRINLFAQMH